VSDQQTAVKNEFRDMAGNLWRVELTLDIARKVERADFTELTNVEVSLINPSEQLLQTLPGNRPLIFALIFLAVEDQIEPQLGIDPAAAHEEAEMAFARNIGGQALIDGREALKAALGDFFPEQATAFAELFATHKEADARVLQRITDMAPRIREAMMATIDREAAALEAEIKAEIEKGTASTGSA